MNPSPRSLLLVLGFVTLVTVGSAVPAQAGPGSLSSYAPLAKAKKPLIDWKKVTPTVKFKASGKLSKTSARVKLVARITVAGKSFDVPVFQMGIKKKGKSVQVKRKVGKLKVSLKVSWQGTRTITISGTAKYMKFKIPMPKIKVKL